MYYSIGKSVVAGQAAPPSSQAAIIEKYLPINSRTYIIVVAGPCNVIAKSRRHHYSPKIVVHLDLLVTKKICLLSGSDPHANVADAAVVAMFKGSKPSKNREE